MYEFVRLTENTGYFDFPTKIGVYRLNEKDVLLIDSGINAKTAARALSILEDKGWRLKTVINTHYHTDHAGGDKYLKETTGCRIYAPERERIFIENPDMEAGFVYGGFPCRDFRKKFMNTPPCEVEALEKAELPKGMEIIPLFGHTAGMVGIKTPDDIYFMADVVNSEKTLEKAKICYVFDIETLLETLEKIKVYEGRLCVPSHAEPTREISRLADANKENILMIQRDIKNLLQKEPLTAEQLVSKLSLLYGMKLDFMGIVKVSAVIRSHLSYLCHRGEISWIEENHLHYWKAE